VSVPRLFAVAAADLRIRFRRTSTFVILALLSACPIFWIQHPSSGRVVMQMGGQRVLYNSAAIGLATAMLGMFFIGLAGYFVVSNAIRRDVITRCGFVLASTPLRSMEYLAGKFVGNVVFLCTFLGGFMVVSMAMQVLRGDVPLEPLVFLEQYLLLTPPILVFVAVLALVFETVPVLSGRLGDAAYFFAWVTLGMLVSVATSQGADWMRYLDVTGLSFVSGQMKHGAEASIHIGLNKFDPAKGVAVFHGLRVGVHVFERLAATLAPLPLLLIALWSFHRFDPIRVKQGGASSGGGLMARLNRWSRPAARPFAFLLRPGRSLSTAVLADVWLTFAARPVLAAAAFGIAIYGIVASPRDVFPYALLGAGLASADIATREQRNRTTALVYAASDLRERQVSWKALTTFAVMLSFVAIPIARMAAAGHSILPALTATFFVAAASVLLGTLSGSPKTFLFLFLSLWYLAVSDKGETRVLDFAGFHRPPTAAIELTYLLAAFVLLGAASLWHRRQRM